jgi:hypothetical protein
MKFKPETQVWMGVAVILLTVASAWGHAYFNLYLGAPSLQRIPKDERALYVLALVVGVWFVIRGIWRLRKEGERSPE